MVQVAKNRYTSDRYHDFIGFNISQHLLEQAFLKTYGLQLSDVLNDEDEAIESFRRAVSVFIPKVTRAALVNRREEIVRDTPNFNEKQFLYHLSRTNYEKDWGKGYRKPSFGIRVLAFFLRLFRRSAPPARWRSKSLAPRPKTCTSRAWTRPSTITTSCLNEVRDGNLALPDTDCDTGTDTAAAEYPLADKAYAQLLDDLAQDDFATATPELRSNILAFYSDPNAPYHTKKNRKEWARTERELEQLKATTVVATASQN